jgi:hypothetical protein
MNHIEIAILAIALLVLGVSVLSLRIAVIDGIVAQRDLSAPKKVVADANIRQEWFKIGISIVMLLSSAAALFLEPPPPAYRSVPQSLVSGIAWIVVGILMIISSLIDKSARRKLITVNDEIRGRRSTDITMGDVSARPGGRRHTDAA